MTVAKSVSKFIIAVNNLFGSNDPLGRKPVNDGGTTNI